jgi:hypothetical protein
MQVAPGGTEELDHFVEILAHAVVVALVTT